MDYREYIFEIDDPMYSRRILDTSKIPKEDLAKAMYDFACDEYRVALRSKKRNLTDDATQLSGIAQSQAFFMALENLDRSKCLYFSRRMQALARRIQLTASILAGLAYHIPDKPKEQECE